MEWLERATILKVLWGSHAFGTANPGSDVDIRGVCIPPKNYLLGLSAFEQAEDTENDTVIYSLAKFMTLALANNPNMLDLLWVNEEHILYMDEYGAELRAHRDLFLSRQVARTYAGYAENQLQRMETHYRWLHQPPTHQPMPEEFGAVPHLKGGMRFPNTHQERAYRSANKHWQNYQHWRAHRNPERAATEERYGYDTKHALHLLRLYRMGIEILQEGVVRVYRPDAAWLRQVKEGLYTYPQLMALVAELKEELAAAEADTDLPEEPNRQQIDDLLISLHWRALQTGRT
jgi:predicted nucleotidyltransferase